MTKIEPPFPSGEYACILCDPPWRFQTWSEARQTRAARNHYDVMDTRDIAKLPIRDIAAPDCAMFMWAINPMLPHAIKTMEAWGFEYRTIAFCWAKRTLRDSGWHFGLGYYTRANVELCLLGVRGKPQRIGKDVAQLIVSPRREHSRKPDEIYERIERLVPGPRIELFSRTDRDGWDSWGNGVGQFKSIPENPYSLTIG